MRQDFHSNSLPAIMYTEIIGQCMREQASGSYPETYQTQGTALYVPSLDWVSSPFLF
ncbi:MAG: hypothetical protein ACI9W2_004875, partial [Gammaproteobacteria bacterium]